MLEGFFSFLFEFLGDLLGEGLLTLLFDRGSRPSKKRINTAIDQLKTESWFKVLYENPNYQKLFLTNEVVRFYIGEQGAKRIKKSEKHQQKLNELLREAYLFEPSFIDLGSYTKSTTPTKKW